MLFWPEISALGVFFNFDNERMHPPRYPNAPPGVLYNAVLYLSTCFEGLSHWNISHQGFTHYFFCIKSVCSKVLREMNMSLKSEYDQHVLGVDVVY